MEEIVGGEAEGGAVNNIWKRQREEEVYNRVTQRRPAMC